MFSFRRYLLVLLLPLLLAGCASYKKSVYLRHDQVLADIEQQGKLYEYRIMPKDELIIVVSTSDPASSVPFLRKLGQNKEMSQNSQRLSWTFEEVDGKLQNIMVNIFHNLDDAAKRYGMEGNYVAGANIAGFEKVVDAMTAQGIV